MIKAWAFYRRSTDKQELSIEDQRKDCLRFATSQGWEIVKEFKPEKGYASGLTIDRDPDFQKMLREAELRQHGASYLLVYDVSRFGRLCPEEKIYWEQRFKKDGGLQVIYVKDDFKNDGSLGDALTRMLKHSEAHEYSMKLSYSTLRGSKSHAQIGNSTGGKAPYGYDRQVIDAHGNPVKVLQKGHHKADKLERVKWTPSSEQAWVIREIFTRADQGKGLNVTVSWLNESKIPSPTGKHWSKGIVHYILRNRTYIGERVYNKRSYKSYRRGEKGSLFNPANEWVICLNAHEPIVDRNLFERVQANLKHRHMGQGRSYHFAHVLSGLVVCENCGNRFNGYTKRGNRGHAYRYYHCSGYTRSGSTVCRSVHVLADQMENLALESIRDLIATPNLREELSPLLRKYMAAAFGPGSKDERKELQTRLDSMNQQISSIIQAIKMGTRSQILLQELAKLESDKQNVEKELAEAQRKVSVADDLDGMVDEAIGYLKNFEGIWADCVTNEEKKACLSNFIHRIDVSHSPEHVQTAYYLYRLPISPENRPARAAIFGNPGIVKANHHLSLLRG